MHFYHIKGFYVENIHYIVSDPIIWWLRHKIITDHIHLRHTWYSVSSCPSISTQIDFRACYTTQKDTSKKGESVFSLRFFSFNELTLQSRHLYLYDGKPRVHVNTTTQLKRWRRVQPVRLHRREQGKPNLGFHRKSSAKPMLFQRGLRPL